jgi:eukaryotic-like serine/threonine-protein kinase
VDHENNEGDDEGSIAVISSDGKGKEEKLSSGWESIEGVTWSPDGDEVWFASTTGGSRDNLRAVTLARRLRSITNVPGGMWLEDAHNGTVLAVTHQERINIRGVAPGEKAERELGWFGWSLLTDMSADGHKILFTEAGDGGGPNYTVFMRDTDGSPPLRIGEGDAMAMSPDGKWAITKSPKGGPLILVPTGAGESKTLTHDNVDYHRVRWLSDGKRVIASGIEAGHGVRTYMIDLSSGAAKPVTPEGISGTLASPDGKSIVVYGTDGKLGIWPLDGSGLHPIPGLDSSYNASRWSPDGNSIYVASSRSNQSIAKIYQVNLAAGKMELWKTFGEQTPGTIGNSAPIFSADGAAYAYIYVRVLSDAYVVTGLK